MKKYLTIEKTFSNVIQKISQTHIKLHHIFFTICHFIVLQSVVIRTNTMLKLVMIFTKVLAEANVFLY